MGQPLVLLRYPKHSKERKLGPLRTEAVKPVECVQSFLQYVTTTAFCRAFAPARFDAASIRTAGPYMRCNLRFVGVELGWAHHLHLR